MRQDTEPVQAAEFAVEYTAASGKVCDTEPVQAVRFVVEYTAGVSGERQNECAKMSGEIGRTCGEIQSQYRRQNLRWSILRRAAKCARQNEWLNWPNMRRDTKPVQAAESAVEYTAAGGEVCAPK
ncbi:hypothetical protein BXZ70DRAFT_903555 [Cristinia sonorae]|uniref:Uncharacterized protein n=1 Tax=Cristinia sonorae TaxID=1940300 RepID=A0A8K0XU95_9AGAR|nr:hypothetical protein BXZ70DRAFT_903555 [Cristinia sonorae]